MIVVDTNIIAYFYLESNHSKDTEILLKHDPVWIVPFLWRSEFRSVLGLYLRKKIISKRDAMEIINRAEIQMKGNEFHVSSSSVLELVHTSGCSAYDCEFICLAKEFQIPLITQDKKILSAFPNNAFSLSSFLS